MNGNISVREVMTREYIGVSESDDLEETGRLLREEDVNGAIVLRGNEPVGTLPIGRILETMLESTGSETVGDAMVPMVKQADGNAFTDEAASQLLGSPGSLLVVTDESDEIVGVVTETDLVRSLALNREPDTQREETLQPAIAGQASENDTQYSNQGICERCGALTSDLVAYNGQLLCNDCRDV